MPFSIWENMAFNRPLIRENHPKTLLDLPGTGFVSNDCITSIPMYNSYIDDKGYERICDSGKLVHRVVAERKLGRKLRAWEVVHHRNRNKLDNRPVNLYVSRFGGNSIMMRFDTYSQSDYVLGV